MLKLKLPDSSIGNATLREVYFWPEVGWPGGTRTGPRLETCRLVPADLAVSYPSPALMLYGIPNVKPETGLVLFSMMLSVTRVTPQRLVEIVLAIETVHVEAEQGDPGSVAACPTIGKRIITIDRSRTVTKSGFISCDR